MSGENFRVVIVFEDNCKEEGGYSINDIMAYDSLDSFIREESVKKIVAYDHFLSGERKALIGFLQALRKIPELDHEIFFLTPFGLIYETKIIAPYRECLKSLSQETIDFFLKETGALEKLNTIFLDQKIKIIILFLSKRIAKHLHVEELVPSYKKVFLIVEEPFRVGSDAVITIYPNKLFEKKAKKIIGLNGGKGFYEIVWRFLLRVLLAIKASKISLDYLINQVKDVIQLFNIFEEEYTAKQTLLIERKETKSLPVIALAYEKITVDETEKGEKIINREIILPSMKLLKKLSETGLKLIVEVYVEKALFDYCKKWKRDTATPRLQINCIEYNGHNPLVITNTNNKVLKIFTHSEPINKQIESTPIILAGAIPPQTKTQENKNLVLTLESEELPLITPHTNFPPKITVLIATKEKKLEETHELVKQSNLPNRVKNIYIWDGKVIYKCEENALKETNTKIAEILKNLERENGGRGGI